MKNALSRRSFLRGASATAAVSISLPFLPSLMGRSRRALAQSIEAPRRLVWFHNPNGADMSRFTPTGEGPNWQPSFALQPLVDAGHQADVSILTGLTNPAAQNPNGHQRCTAAFLTGKSVPESAAPMNDISADQIAANAIGHQTRFRSLQLGMRKGGLSNSNSQGYPSAYNHSISFRGPGEPLPNETSPRAVFNRLFGQSSGVLTPAQVEKQKRYKQSVLDLVMADTARIKSRVNTTDAAKLDQYLTGIRELETRIDSLDDLLTCDPGSPPPESQVYPERIRQMLDIIVLALTCDVTRVITFMRYSAGASDGSLGPYNWVTHTDGNPINQEFHTLSHHADREPELAKCASINRWEITNLVYLLDRMKAVNEGEGTLLDSCALAYASPLGNTHWHDPTNPPFILAGRCGGRLNPGRHIRLNNTETTANVWLSMLQAADVQVSSLGDVGTGPVSGL